MKVPLIASFRGHSDHASVMGESNNELVLSASILAVHDCEDAPGLDNAAPHSNKTDLADKDQSSQANQETSQGPDGKDQISSVLTNLAGTGSRNKNALPKLSTRNDNLCVHFVETTERVQSGATKKATGCHKCHCVH